MSTATTAVLDHGMGNLRSVAKALEAAGAHVRVTADPKEIDACDSLCVPGQGIFGRCIENIVATNARDLIVQWVNDDRPYLGICLGMQILFEESEEGDVDGLGIVAGRVTRLPDTVTVPHIGWNTVARGDRDTYFYFDHSFAAQPADPSLVSGWCDHGGRFAAAIETGSILGVQFHPEKSGSAGIDLLRGWLN
ncbi:MAG TPA: imidazole glycerol phosphate synthase subunit HisH [Actinomycetota bacterium]|nr:imidazole glycerol phosphate synthase subunit HisH [Actinomycetota bacterium]